MNDENLIFIISQPRSGSTLLQKIISNNEEVSTSSEPWILFPFALFERPDLLDARYNSNMAYRAYSDFIKKNDLQPFIGNQIKSIILSIYDKANEGGKFFLDKTPRYYEILPQIHEWFPNAKYIILKRNPFAVLDSIINTWADGVLDFSTLKTVKRDFLQAPDLIQKFTSATKNAPNVRELYYESLVENPEHLIQELYDWIGLDYTKNRLNFSSNHKADGIFGDGIYGVHRDTNYGEYPVVCSKDKWTEKLDNKKISEFFQGYSNYLTNDFLFEYGYTPLQSGKSMKLFDEFILFSGEVEGTRVSSQKRSFWNKFKL